MEGVRGGIGAVGAVSLLGRPGVGQVNLAWHAVALRWFISFAAIFVVFLYAGLAAYIITRLTI